VVDLNATHVAQWRDARLKVVSNATVLREWNLLSHVCAIAVKEWHWLRLNPFKEVKRPKAPEARWRRISQDEIERLLVAMGYDYTPPETIIARVGAAFLFSIETGLRAGELCALRWSNVHARHVHIPISKNGYKRDVPLSAEARRILDELPKENSLVFNLVNTQIDSLFRKAKSRCLIEGLHWHDTRHEALTRLSQKLNVMELAKIAGIRDLRILQNVYYNPSIEDLANKL
jgi:integrase